MTYKILWAPLRWTDDHHIEHESAGDQCEAVLAASLEEITQDQWLSCDAIVSLTDVPERYRSQAKNCKIFVTPKVGYDNIDIKAWAAAGIPVCNVPDYGTMEVADHAIAMYLSLVRGITYHSRELQKAPDDNWLPIRYKPTRRLSTSTFGIVGLGRIGMATALRAKAFGMDVCFFDPHVENGRDKALGVRRVDDLQYLFSQCDAVSIHVPLSRETDKLINAEVLASSKPNLMLINTARGPVIDLDALYHALKTDQLQAAALDVLPEEKPVDKSHPLLRAWSAQESWIDHRLLLTPHSAFYSTESMYDMRFLGGQGAAQFLTKGVLRNCVNSEYLTG
ncbi:hypothetical protein AB833_25260 [Chromatiales bacterium (ex Bugula neritina AB1)]|nr:hypothetical protein AB833_25260 [Chromatiales bacterium (ex Bugula neritina AB1)]